MRVLAEKAKEPARLENFRIEVDVPVELDERHRAGIEAAVHHCLIHNTLLHPPQIEIAIDHAALVAMPWNSSPSKM